MQSKSFKIYFQKLFALTFCLSILTSGFIVNAQTGRGTTRPTKTSAAKSAPSKSAIKPGVENQTGNCKGGWSGIITFEKKLKDEYNPGKKKNVSPGTTELRTSREYKYTGRIVVDGTNPKMAQTKTQVLFKDADKSFKRFENMDTCAYDGTDAAVLHWSETTDNRIYNAFGEGAAESFNPNLNPYDGTYNFSFRFPDARGTVDYESKLRRGGWCNPKNNLPSDNSRTEPTVVEGTGAELGGKIDPNNPDVLAGSPDVDAVVAERDYAVGE